MMLFTTETATWWMRLAGDLLVIPAAVLGGHLRVLRKGGAAPR
jgi:hypothetical protein